MKRALAALVVLGAAFAVALPLAASAGSTVAQPVALVIKSDTEHGKKGPDGKWHDAYLPGGFTVKAGRNVKVTIRNYDDAIHTFTAAGLGLNVQVRPGSAAHPSLTTFTFKASKPGSYIFRCMGMCDPFAMTHMGYMMGTVRVVA
jgi:nitrous oxide reductase